MTTTQKVSLDADDLEFERGTGALALELGGKEGEPTYAELESHGNTYTGWLKFVDKKLERFWMEEVSSEELGYSSPTEKNFYRPRRVDFPRSDYDFHLEYLALDDLTEFPYSVRDRTDVRSPEGYVDDIAERGSLIFAPVVRDAGEQYEVIDGHTGLELADMAGLDAQTCIVDDRPVQESTAHFIVDHVPPPGVPADPENSWYTDEEIRELIEAMDDSWVEKVERLSHHRDRLF